MNYPMERVSTNLTLFFKFFIPVFWMVLVGATTLASLLTEYSYVGTIPAGPFKIGITLFFLSGAVVLAFTFMRLKRVEMSTDFVYVTNYFKTARYTYDSIERWETSEFLFLSVNTIVLKEAGIMGRHLKFFASRTRLRQFWEAHPELAAKFA